jgi:hypothetical protein
MTPYVGVNTIRLDVHRALCKLRLRLHPITYDNIDVEVLAQNLDLKLEVELQLLFLMQLRQNIHDAHRPRVWGFEHLRDIMTTS